MRNYILTFDDGSKVTLTNCHSLKHAARCAMQRFRNCSAISHYVVPNVPSKRRFVATCNDTTICAWLAAE